MLTNDAKMFLTLWASAGLLLLWLGDYNVYLHFPDGTTIVKQHAHLPDRLIWSPIFGLLYAITCTFFMKRWLVDGSAQEHHQGANTKSNTMDNC